MRIFLIISLAFIILSGCASKPQYGNFVPQAVSTNINKLFVADTVKQLQLLYPPAKTRFNLGQSVPDTDIFGMTLIATLRDKGYAIQEFNPEQPSSTQGINFRYIVDIPSAAMPYLYRVTVIAGTNSLSRAYVVQNNTANPAGAWAYKDK